MTVKATQIIISRFGQTMLLQTSGFELNFYVTHILYIDLISENLFIIFSEFPYTNFI